MSATANGPGMPGGPTEEAMQRARAEQARASRERPAPEERNAENAQATPDIAEAIRELGETGRATATAAGDIVKAMRSLIAADIALARSAAGRSMVAAGVAMAGGTTAWLLLMATVVMLLRGPAGLSWLAALLVPAAISLVVAGIGGWLAMRYFEHTRLQATRRQFARIGIGELANFVSDPGSARSARQDTEQVPSTDATGEPVKDPRGVEVTPP